MAFIVTEPVRIKGTKLGYAVYPYQFSVLDREKKKHDDARLYIFELKDTNFVEVKRTLMQKDISLSMQASKEINVELKRFIMSYEGYITNINEMDKFFNENKEKVSLF